MARLVRCLSMMTFAALAGAAAAYEMPMFGAVAVKGFAQTGDSLQVTLSFSPGPASQSGFAETSYPGRHPTLLVPGAYDYTNASHTHGYYLGSGLANIGTTVDLERELYDGTTTSVDGRRIAQETEAVLSLNVASPVGNHEFVAQITGWISTYTTYDYTLYHDPATTWEYKTDGKHYMKDPFTVNVRVRRDMATGAVSVDTRTTYGQPDEEGAIVPDPNEVPGPVRFYGSKYYGGLFIGDMTEDAKDCSGLAWLQVYGDIGQYTGSLIGHGVALFCPARTDRYPATNASLTAVALSPTSNTDYLTQSIGTVDWNSRWSSNLAGGPPTYASVSVAQGSMACFALAFGESVQLGKASIRPYGYGGSCWRYFYGQAFHDALPTEAKDARKLPHFWTVSKDAWVHATGRFELPAGDAWNLPTYEQ